MDSITSLENVPLTAPTASSVANPIIGRIFATLQNSNNLATRHVDSADKGNGVVPQAAEEAEAVDIGGKSTKCKQKRKTVMKVLMT